MNLDKLSASNITELLKVRPNLTLQLTGDSEVDPTSIRNYEDYEAIYKKRHDLIHAAVCDKLELPFGERKIQEVLNEQAINLENEPYYDEVKNQTPDYFGVKGKNVLIVEITVSADLRARDRKTAKYALLCTILRHFFEVEYKVFVFNPLNIFIDRDYMINYGLDDPVLDFAHNVCTNTRELLSLIHSTLEGTTWYEKFYKIEIETPLLEFSAERVIKTHMENKNKCFHSLDDLKTILKEANNPKISEEDEDFISNMVNMAKTCKSEFLESEEFQEKDFIDDMNMNPTTKELRSVLPMCNITPRIIDSSIRSTTNDAYELEILSSKMISCSDIVISKIGSVAGAHYTSIKDKPNLKNEEFLFKCHLSQDEEYIVALEGPGRKKYLKKSSPEHIKEDNHNTAYNLSLDVDVSDIEQISYYLSTKNRIYETGNIYTDMQALSEADGPGLNYVKMIQSIYREININAMRGDRRHKFIIKPTGAKGVYICLYPGTKLRCGELANIVWFKIIIDNDLEDPNIPFNSHWIFKKLKRDGQISYTRWLSCDVHRLDHYIRCYDKILMTYSSILSQKFKLEHTETINSEQKTISSLINSFNNDRTNTLGLIILIYLEDKRSTSKMLQNVRYLVMTSLSIFPKYRSVMEKFKDPIRTPLQSYLLKRCLNFITLMKKWSISENCSFGNVRYDHATHTFIDMMGGSIIQLPRPITSSDRGFAEFSEILCEMYFTMLFNKNQDDPTHASFQILDKILEGESNFIKVKHKNNHLGYKPELSDVEFAKLIIEEKKTHMFSKKAIEIGSKILRSELGDEVGEHIKIASTRHNMNKTIDEFAKYKSSSNLESRIYNPMKNIQNSRRRCIEGVMSLLEEGIYTSYQVAEKYCEESTYYHVFKKNQIGGVREILILPITNRIRINILETFSRNICRFDKREVLTHGATKNESIKSLLYNAKKLEGPRAPIHLTFDKSKWGPSFVPIQFIYLFNSFKKDIPGLFNFIVDLMIRHQNKECVLPERLVKAWFNDQQNVYEHKFPELQKIKENFLIRQNLTIDNESNMGQGILHYTSSLLHLCMISFRNRIYKQWCKEMGLDYNDHEDLLSSDDSYTLFCPEIVKDEKSKFISIKLKMFLQCQQLSEYLFNCRTSKVKSSINPLIGEFNSLFISNMTFIPTLLKFCLSSVHPPNTDSFYRMVKECFGSSRQIVENGGGLDLYLLSSYLNKKYCEGMYHTYPGGVNDLAQFGVNIKPYHIGEYPIFNPAHMVCFGPEYHNYLIYKKYFPIMNENERNLFISSHKIIKGGLIETMAEFEDGDTVLGGLMRIEAAIGPVKQLERIKRSAIMKKDDIEQLLVVDPLRIITPPKTLEDVIFKTVHKLYTNGSKEALKNIAASIFYGRVSATVSANCFYIPNGSLEQKTYLQCVNQLIYNETNTINFDDHIKFLYPKYVDYEGFINQDDSRLQFIMRNPMEIQTVQKLTTHKIFTKLNHSVSSILEYKWKMKAISEFESRRINRDFDLMSIHFPLIKDSVQETLNQFSGSIVEQTKGLLLLILKLFSLKDKSFKGVVYGPNSNDIHKTIENLVDYNISNSAHAESSMRVFHKRNYNSNDKIFLAYNQTILKSFTMEHPKSIWETIEQQDIDLLMSDNGINKGFKKRIFMIALPEGFFDQVEAWTLKIGLIMHYWHIRQRYDKKENKYKGSFKITAFVGPHQLTCHYQSKTKKISLHRNNLQDPELMYLLLEEISNNVDMTINEIIDKTNVGEWILKDKRILKATGGFEIKDLARENVEFDNAYVTIDEDWIKLRDSQDRIIYSVETGLLPCEATQINPEFDFRVFNMKFSTFCINGCFNQGFNILFKNRSESLGMLEDLEVLKPLVSDLTKNRLKLPDSWEVSKELEDIKEEIIIEDETDLYGDLINMDIDINDLGFITKELSEFEGKIDLALNFLLTTDAIRSMKTQYKIHHSRKLFKQIKNLKYDVICRNLLLDMKINKQTIITLRSMIRGSEKDNIIYSLISYYDRSYLDNATRSPMGIIVDISQDFINKFGLEINEESW